MRSRLRLVVLGMMGRCPFAGQTWLYVNWLRALTSLGHEVYYIEDDIVWPFDPRQNRVTDDFHYAVDHVSRCMAHIGLRDRWAVRFFLRRGASWGMESSAIDQLYRTCDAVLNICGATELRDEHKVAPLRVYVETDPVIAELRVASGDNVMKSILDDHNAFFTYGENYGAADCGVPLSGLDFHMTRQPVDLGLWPMTYEPEATYFTTVGNYRQVGKDVSYGGEVYRWSKHFEWERILNVPRRTNQPFDLAINVEDAADFRLLRSHGWHLRYPVQLSLDVFGAYPRYIRSSRAELTVAKDQNVRLRSGWFSERDVCYLASGKPVVAQDTGFSNVLPIGEGLFAFMTTDEAVEAVDAVNRDYRRHCEAARALAEDHFAGPKVAARFLADLGIG